MTASPRRPGRPRAAEFTTPLTIPGGAVAGAELVRELPTEVSLAVWQTLRSVLLWAAEEPALRGDLFEPCAMEEWETELLEDGWDPDVRSPLAVLVGQLARLGEASPETIAHACLAVTDWALEHGYVSTALGFAEAAGLAWPQHPRFAWIAGRLLRRHGRLREAEPWMRRAAKNAASLNDREGQVLALNSLGNVFHDQGRNPQSLRTLKDALRLARRHRLRKLEGEILHDLFVVATWGGEPEHSDEYAQAAFEIYKTGHPRLAALAHDVANLWILRGYHERAFAVLRQLPPFIPLPEEQVRVWGSLARAAAGCGEQAVYQNAAHEVWALSGRWEARPRAASALLEVGLGAANLEEWSEAERALKASLELATDTGELDLVERATAALADLGGRTAEEEAARRRSDARSARHADALVEGFLASLSEAPLPVGA